MKAIPVMKLESSTRSSNVNAASTASERVLAPARPVSKFKLPVGVVPIPILMDQKLDNTDNGQREEAKKKEESVQHAQLRNNPLHANSKDNEQVEDGDNLDPQFPPLQGGRHGDQGLNRRGNDALFRVRPGVQEIGDELNHLGRLPGFDDAAGQQVEAGDDQYDGVDYDKQPQQKNDIHLAEDEDEGEDEDDQTLRIKEASTVRLNKFYRRTRSLLAINDDYGFTLNTKNVIRCFS
ncbi:hypothetical protein KM043_012571 [Ampulex compressa]|nr:hypothetical protein KM043_012571 [Ampulex compressa]